MGPLAAKALALIAADAIDVDQLWTLRNLVTPRMFKMKLLDMLETELNLRLGLERIEVVPPRIERLTDASEGL